MPSSVANAIIHGLQTSSEVLREVSPALRVSAVVDFAEVASCARPALVAALWRANGGQFFVWSASPDAADRFANDSAFYLGAAGAPVYTLRPRDAANAPVNPSERSDRLTFLDRLASGQPGIYCVSQAAARQRLPDPAQFAAARLERSVGQEYPWEKLIAALSRLGYERVDVVSAVGEYAVRGGLIDIFPATSDYPVRLEFFGDRLEQIRRFVLSTQRSTGELTAVQIGPWSELIEFEATGCIWQYAPSAALFIEDAEGIVAIDHGLRAAREDTTVASADLAADDAAAVVGDGVPQDRATTLDTEDAATLDTAETNALEPEPFTLEELTLAARGRPIVNFIPGTGSVRLSPPADLTLSLPAQAAPAFGRSIERFIEYVRAQFGRRVALAIVSVGYRRIRELLDEHDLVCSPVPAQLTLPPESSVIMCDDGNIDCGFVVPSLGLIVMGDNELYGHPARRQKIKAAKEGAPLSEADLKPGEFFVHANHGIGQYLGLERLTVADVERDFMHLKYAGQDRLYVPIDQMHLVRKYIASDGASPRLSKMGGSDWARTRSRVREAVEKIADGLVRLYAARELAIGHAFSPDTPWQAELEESFPYDETPDQQEAIQLVKTDMERSRPMDRLVCGDVGYGKTEVAIRAAFKADHGSQAGGGPRADHRVGGATLPTPSANASPHFRSKIALLSRFRSKAEQKETLRELQAGSVDHRHRHAPAAAERRRIQATGPRHHRRRAAFRRHAQRTAQGNASVRRRAHAFGHSHPAHAAHGDGGRTRDVAHPNRAEQPGGDQDGGAPSSDALIGAALNQELDRGGQVYFVHNRIETIYGVAAAVQKLAPRARIAIGHGQMREHELEDVMLAFVNGEIDVLVSTTIIENGLDIPNVNTIIINNADHFGLAQLYQLRGRVGRAAHQAYAYFLYQPHRALSEVAQSRLQAIREFSHLGSGLQLAMRDLEIRGAGNLLGREQHGFIAAVGFETYCNILQEAVAARRGEILAQPEVPPVLDIRVSAYLPSEYVRGTNQKVAFYQRLAAARGLDEVDVIGEELRDRFGPLPREAQALLELTRLRVLATAKGVQKVALEQRRLTLDMGPKFSLSEQALPNLTSITGGNFRFTQGAIVAGLPADGTPVARLINVRELIQAL